MPSTEVIRVSENLFVSKMLGLDSKYVTETAAPGPEGADLRAPEISPNEQEKKARVQQHLKDYIKFVAQ